MKLKNSIFKLSVASFMLLASCSNDLTNFAIKTNFPPLSDNDIKINSESKIVTANNKFGVKLFSEILKSDKDKNTFISPTSALFALSMTYNGASGTTKDEMAKALELTGMSDDEINKENNSLIRTLINSDPQVRIDIANSLWGNKNISFSPEFTKTNETYYKATDSILDFSDPNSANIINKWVSDSTQGKISKITDKLDTETLAVLINAIYFKGQWSEKFNKNYTKLDNFNLADKSTKQVQMMSITESFPYYKNEKFEAVSLPYGNKNISMYVFLPSTDSSLEEFNKNLTDDNLKTWFSQFNRNEIDLKLPKFKLEYGIKMNDYLKSLGMTTAFSDSADLSKMFKDKNSAYISEVQQKTFVEVNEEGTEAAAATGVFASPTSAMISTQMNVDRPFFYAIRDNKSGTILFMGEVVDPS